MRDEDRIDDVLAALEEHWREHPQLRLAQIVGNIGQEQGYGTDPYYLEDSDLLRSLESKNRNS